MYSLEYVLCRLAKKGITRHAGASGLVVMGSVQVVHRERTRRVAVQERLVYGVVRGLVLTRPRHTLKELRVQTVT